MEENKRGIWGSILFWMIPLLFTVIVVAVVLNFVGIPVWESLQKLPVINQIVPDSAKSDENSNKQVGSDYWKKEYTKLETTLKEKDQKIDELNKQIKEIETSNNSNEELQKQSKINQSNQSIDQMKQVSGIYESIPASKAAAMFDTMSLEEAGLTLSMLDQEIQGNILGKMKDPKKAAQLTSLLREIAMLNESNPALLQEQIKALAQNQANPTDVLSETIAEMPAAQSASIIESMMATNFQVAMNIMKNIRTETRSQILAEIAKSNAAKAAQITADLNN